MEKIVVLGGGGHAASVVDSIRRMKQYDIIGYTDYEEDKALDLKYIGTDSALEELYNSGITNAVVCVGYLGASCVRDKLYQTLKTIGFTLPLVVDPNAAISSNCVIGEGSFIGKNAVVNARTKIGKMCIINTNSTIEHDCIIGDYSHVSVGANVCGGVQIGHHSFIGAGTTVIQGNRIGDDVIIGAGSIVICNVQSKKKAFGIVKD